MLAKREEDKKPAEFGAFWDFQTERSRSHSMEREKKRRKKKKNPRKSAVNEKSFYWWFWKNINYIKTASA